MHGLTKQKDGVEHGSLACALRRVTSFPLPPTLVCARDSSRNHHKEEMGCGLDYPVLLPDLLIDMVRVCVRVSACDRVSVCV